MAISAWLVPWEPESAILQQLMARHPEPVAPHSFPHFHPHVTLATVHVDPALAPPPPPPPPPSDPEAAAASASHDAYDAERAALLLALREARGPLPPLDLRRDRAVLRAGAAAGRAGGRARARARGRAAGVPAPLAVLRRGGGGARARRYLQELEREGVVRHAADGLSAALWCAGEDGVGRGGGAVLEGFTGTQIWIVDCGGPVEGWRVLDKILLAKSEG
ncbi:hypothetical protein BC826DRAFT_1183198 [Russula brevipes]|nr:hypothetical protein BC826DRAFT_1183198 [Russula brevipes]